MSELSDLAADVAALRIEVKYLKYIIPSACGFVAVLILVFWGRWDRGATENQWETGDSFIVVYSPSAK